jgi:hypothetical protein
MRAILPAAVVTAILGAVAWQTGCNTNLSYVSEDHFAAEYAQALCTSLQPCCSENDVAYDYQACAAGWQAVVENLLYGPTSTGNYNAADATNCIAQIRAAQGASCQPVPGSLSAARDTCQAIFAGTAPLGAPCTSAAQCAPIDGSVVTCAVPAGESADGGGGGELPLEYPGLSPQGLTVSPQDVPVCVSVSPPDGGAAGSGPPCSIRADAGTDTCQATGMYCDPKALTCTPLSTAGGACDPSVVSSCQAGNYCAPAGGGAGSCILAGPVGTPCTAAPMCDSTGFCDLTVSHTCLAIEQPGQSCTSGLACSIGVCDATTHTCLTNAIATTAACTGAVTTQ